MPAKKTTDGTIHVPQLAQERQTFVLTGTTGLICHRMGAKAKHTLLVGGGRKTAAERLELKHDPVAEFRDSMDIEQDFHPHSHVTFPAMAFKSAMATAALVVAGIRKTDVQRMIYIPEDRVPVFGVPRLRMDIVRSADMNKTPDVRTRAFFPTWATALTVEWSKPMLSETSIVALLHNAGRVCGIGDWRQEKGKGSFGTFTVEKVGGDLPDDVSLLDSADQWDAIENPVAANTETQRLLVDFAAEVEARR